MKPQAHNTGAFETLTELGQVESIASQWNALLERTPCNRAFSSAQWYLAACRHFPAIAPYVLVARRGTELAGILPLAVHHENATARFATNLADYNDIIALPDDLEVCASLLNHALSFPRSYDQLALTDLRSDSNCVRALSLIKSGAKQLLKTYASCPYVSLSESYEQYIKTRSKLFRISLHRAQARIARKGLTIRELEPQSFPADQLPEVFLSLHLDRLGNQSSFARAPEQGFVREVLPKLLAERRLRVFSLFEEDRIVAINLCMVGSDSLCYWNGGFEAQAGRWSPGKLLLDVGIKQAWALGLSEYDLLRGSEDYKADLANGERQTYQLELKRAAQE
jgi:CelD/BcsL family acetyltransferase involved in cellulose biosynthesis